MKTSIILVFTAGIALMFGTHALACGPGGGSKSKSSGGGVGVGVGVNIDLGGIGQRKREGDPFAPGGGGQPVSRTQKKPQTTRKQHEPSTTSDFANVELTGEKAKGEIESPKPLNVSDENEEIKPHEPSTTSDFANVELTGEKAKGEIEPPKPLNVSDENEEMQPPMLPKGEVFTTTPRTTGSPMEQFKAAKDAYRKARKEYLEKQLNWKKIAHDLAGGKNTEEDNKKGHAAYKEMEKLIDQFNSNEGKNLVADWKSAYDNAVKAGEKTDDYIPPP
jgi:hypothetical protein